MDEANTNQANTPLNEMIFRVNPPVSSDTLNALFATVWVGHQPRDFAPILTRSLVYVCAYDAERLVGFVNLAWDGGIHAFLLDTTVHAGYQRRGIGQRLVEIAVSAARERGIEWVHVDFEPHLSDFYAACGFTSTPAGLINLT